MRSFHSGENLLYRLVTRTSSTLPSSAKLQETSATCGAADGRCSLRFWNAYSLVQGGNLMMPRRSSSARAFRQLWSLGRPDIERQSSHSQTSSDSARRDIPGSSDTRWRIRSTTSLLNHWPKISMPPRLPGNAHGVKRGQMSAACGEGRGGVPPLAPTPERRTPPSVRLQAGGGPSMFAWLRHGARIGDRAVCCDFRTGPRKDRHRRWSK
ncbi:MAG: hypothetical protein BWY10_02586 [Chloroflexi bacterium ADurb.Bin180]|nr:MAG: hypothetical protein BWY10_02586 [Chloroflexi bacterium ADurb.Bin180]